MRKSRKFIFWGIKQQYNYFISFQIRSSMYETFHISLHNIIIIVVVVLPRILCKVLNFGLTSAFCQPSENIYENFK